MNIASEFNWVLAPLGALAFLASGGLFLLSLVLTFSALMGRSFGFAALFARITFAIPAIYLAILAGVSATSHEKMLQPGGWKYFCEIDCHAAYTVAGAEVGKVPDGELDPEAKQGEAVIVRIKTWFDPQTISPHRGNGALQPNPRRILLIDDARHVYLPETEWPARMPHPDMASTPFGEALRPGESYATDFVFAVPRNEDHWRLLISDAAPETHFLVGHENSLFHKKIYFDVRLQKGASL